MLKRNLAQEPWLSMNAMCDAMDEENDQYVRGWRLIAEHRVMPLANGPDMTNKLWTCQWSDQIVGAKAWEHDSITWKQTATIASTAAPLETRHARQFKTVMVAWEALAVAWSQTGGK